MNANPWRRLWLVCVFFLVGCGSDADPTTPDDDTTTPDPYLASLVEVSGQDQSGWPGRDLKGAFVVRALDQSGNPLGGVPVQWSVSTGGGDVDRATSTTDASGEASTLLTVGREAVSQRVVATAGTALSVEFRAEAAVVGEWVVVAELLHPLRAPAVATDGERIFAFGGNTGTSSRVAYTQILNVASGTWTRGADIPKPVEWSSAIYVNGRVHLLGGVTNEFAATDEHWIYSPSADSWDAASTLASPAAGSAAGAVGGRIFVAGGIDGPSNYVDDLRVLDLTTDTWSMGTSVPASRINWQGAVIDNLFFMAGGLSTDRVTSSALLSYDPAGGSWSSRQPLSTPTEGYAGTEVTGLYCVLGGRLGPQSGSFNTPYVEVECYEPVMNEWLRGPDLPLAVEEAGAISVDGDLFIIGGRVSYSGVTGAVYRLAW